jgi:hypothetical protein
MFEPARTSNWESVHRKEGAHYNTFGVTRGADAMAALREWFGENAEADEMNFVLFSTSGVHGSYATIEDAERWLNGERDEDDEVESDGEDGCPDVTFLLVQPRIVCLRYGNCQPKNADDIRWLKKLRASSWKAARKVGAP